VVGSEVNAEKAKHVFISYHQKGGQNNNTVMVKFFESVTKLQYFRMAVRNEKYILKYMSRLNSGNTWLPQSFYLPISNLKA
jgi:hypothetical protein